MKTKFTLILFSAFATMSGKAYGLEYLRRLRNILMSHFFGFCLCPVFAVIQTKDSVLLGRADNQGFFGIEIPDSVSEIQVWFVGMESETLRLSRNCEYLEIILLNDMIVEFETVNEAKKQYKKKTERTSGTLYKSLGARCFQKQRAL